MPKMLVTSPATYADLAHENLMLLVALWRLAWSDDGTVEHYCQICGACGLEKPTIKHQAGCALFGRDRALLAQLDAFDTMPEKV